jgi:hypothetical protein
VANTADLLTKMFMGSLVVQTAVCEALIEKGLIERASLIEKIASKVGPSAGPLDRLAAEYVGAVLSGRQPPAAPASLH